MHLIKKAIPIIIIFAVIFMQIDRPFYLFHSTDVEVDYYWSSFSLLHMGISNSFSHPGFIVQIFGAILLYFFNIFNITGDIQENIIFLRSAGLFIYIILLLIISYGKNFKDLNYIFYPLMFSWMAMYPSLLYYGVDTYVLILSIPIGILTSRIINCNIKKINLAFLLLVSIAISVKIIFLPILLIYATLLSIHDEKLIFKIFFKILFVAIFFILILNLYQYNLYIDFIYKVIILKIAPFLFIYSFAIYIFIKINILNFKNIMNIITYSSIFFIIINISIINPLIIYKNYDWTFFRNLTPYYFLAIFIVNSSLKNVNFRFDKIINLTIYSISSIFLFIILINNILFINQHKINGIEFQQYITSNYIENNSTLYWPGSGNHGIIPFDFIGWGWYRYISMPIPESYVRDEIALIPLRHLIADYKKIKFIEPMTIIKNLKNLISSNNFEVDNFNPPKEKNLIIMIKCGDLEAELSSQNIDLFFMDDFIAYLTDKYHILNYKASTISLGTACWNIYQPRKLN